MLGVMGWQPLRNTVHLAAQLTSGLYLQESPAASLGGNFAMTLSPFSLETTVHGTVRDRSIVNMGHLQEGSEIETSP